jgi:hypothetical protein
MESASSEGRAEELEDAALASDIVEAVRPLLLAEAVIVGSW